MRSIHTPGGSVNRGAPTLGARRAARERLELARVDKGRSRNEGGEEDGRRGEDIVR